MVVRQTLPRLPLAILILIVIAALPLLMEGPSVSAQTATPTPTPTASGRTYGPLVSTAMKYVLQHKGQCRVFVQEVVREATGRVIGNDYFKGYLDAGAVEVPLEQAKDGDIIQLADPKNSGPDADYPGLHTAIVMENLGGGRFKVIDSNVQLDEIVRIHEYEPQASADRFENIVVRVYRLPEGRVTASSTTTRSATPTSTAARSAAPTPTTTVDDTPRPRDEVLEPGTKAVIEADGDCLRIREEGDISAQQVACLATGTVVSVLEGTVLADGYRWQKISGASVIGWAADMYLRPATEDDVAQESTTAAVSTQGTIIGGLAPTANLISLFVFGGGTNDALVAASGCPAATATFWATVEGSFVSYIPAATIGVVNASWNNAFGDELPAGIPLIGRCA